MLELGGGFADGSAVQAGVRAGAHVGSATGTVRDGVGGGSAGDGDLGIGRGIDLAGEAAGSGEVRAGIPPGALDRGSIGGARVIGEVDRAAHLVDGRVAPGLGDPGELDQLLGARDLLPEAGDGLLAARAWDGPGIRCCPASRDAGDSGRLPGGPFRAEDRSSPLGQLSARAARTPSRTIFHPSLCIWAIRLA